jgi:hypothetical protein
MIIGRGGRGVSSVVEDRTAQRADSSVDPFGVQVTVRESAEHPLQGMTGAVDPGARCVISNDALVDQTEWKAAVGLLLGPDGTKPIRQPAGDLGPWG